jgi:hypothetical protein
MECAAPTLCAIQRISVFGYLPTPAEPNCGVCEHHCLNHPDTRWSQAENGAQNGRLAPAGDASPCQAPASVRYLVGYFRAFCDGKRQARELRLHPRTEWRWGQSRANPSLPEFRNNSEKNREISILRDNCRPRRPASARDLRHFRVFMRGSISPVNRELSGNQHAGRSSYQGLHTRGVS